MTCDRWHVTCDTWNVCDARHVTHDTWHMTGGSGGTFPHNFISLILVVWELKVACDTWHVTPDTWQLTPDTRPLTHDMWHVSHDTHREMNTVAKFMVPSSFGLGVKVLWRCWTKGWPSKWMNEWNKHKDVWQTQANGVAKPARNMVWSFI